MGGYYLIIIISMAVSWYVSWRLKSKFEHYSNVHLRNGLSGKEVAEKMLRDNGINDVQVMSVPGQLTVCDLPLFTAFQRDRSAELYKNRTGSPGNCREFIQPDGR